MLGAAYRACGNLIKSRLVIIIGFHLVTLLYVTGLSKTLSFDSFRLSPVKIVSNLVKFQELD